MSLSKFRRALTNTHYKNHSIRLSEGSVYVDSNIIMENYDDISSAYAYARSYIDAIEIINTTNTLSEEKIAALITKYHNIKVTDTLIEAYAELISSDNFSLDPVVLEMKVGASSLNNKLEFTLDDNTLIAIDESTKDKLLALSVDKYKLVDYMKESKENFFSVIKEIRE